MAGAFVKPGASWDDAQRAAFVAHVAAKVCAAAAMAAATPRALLPRFCGLKACFRVVSAACAPAGCSKGMPGGINLQDSEGARRAHALGACAAGGPCLRSDVTCTHVCARAVSQVAKCKGRAAMDEVLHLELYELLREGMVGGIPPGQVGAALKDVMSKASLPQEHWEDVVCDLLWLLGEEALEGKEEDNKLRAGIAGVFKDIVACGVSVQVLQARVSEEALEAAGLIKSAKDEKGKLMRLRTTKIYSQQKFNLLREESEGYSKLVVDIELSLGGPLSERAVEALTKRVMALIAYFNLDPNRVLDVMLDCLEAHVHRPRAQVARFVSLVTKFNRAALVNVVGFKFQGYETLSVHPPESLYQMLAVLCRHRAVTIAEIYPFLSASDDLMVSAFDKHHERLLKSIKKMQIKVISKDDAPREEETQIDAAPHSDSGLDNQKLQLTAALLNMGDWDSAKHMLNVMAQLLPASYPPVSAGLCKLVHQALEPAYSALTAAAGLAALSSFRRNKKSSDGGSQETNDGSMEVDAVIEGDAVDTLPVVRNAAELPKIMPLMKFLGVYIAYDPVLFMKLGKMLKEYMEETKSGGRDTEFVKAVLLDMVGALVLMPANAAAANYIWESIRELPYLDRYWIYSELQWKSYIAHPQLLLKRAQFREEMRKILKSMTKDNVRKKRNIIGHMSHSQPLIICECMLDQSMEFESMIDICKEALHYCSSLCLDVLSFLMVEEVCAHSLSPLSLSLSVPPSLSFSVYIYTHRYAHTYMHSRYACIKWTKSNTWDAGWVSTWT